MWWNVFIGRLVSFVLVGVCGVVVVGIVTLIHYLDRGGQVDGIRPIRWNAAMEVDEITIPSPDFPGGQTFGPVMIEGTWEGPVDLTEELPVTFALQHCQVFGIIWYPQTCNTRGVFNVTADRIVLRPTAPVLVERAAWWRRFGYWLLTRPNRTSPTRADARGPMSRK